jgi:isoaspartyl peptidase/L-asparaginase-like protein (Ntn-hydrolase superfamily)
LVETPRFKCPPPTFISCVPSVKTTDGESALVTSTKRKKKKEKKKERKKEKKKEKQKEKKKEKKGEKGEKEKHGRVGLVVPVGGVKRQRRLI